MKQLILFALFGAFTFNLNAQTHKEFETDAFSAIDISDAFQVFLEHSNEHSVTVESPSDLLDKINIEVKNGTLNVSLKKDAWWKGWKTSSSKVEVHITCPELDALSISGASKLQNTSTFHLDDLDLNVSGASTVSMNATFDDLKLKSDGASSIEMDIAADNISLRTSGASHIELRGEADDMSITCSGASNVQASQIKTGEVVVAASGASNVDLWITDDLTVAASGGSSIRYKCDGCDDVTVKTTGGASVKKY